jgi:hypothetical protein
MRIVLPCCDISDSRVLLIGIEMRGAFLCSASIAATSFVAGRRVLGATFASCLYKGARLASNDALRKKIN